jgi:elongation factor P hydroxylase
VVELSCQQISVIFHDKFAISHEVRLRGGGKEPLYLPASRENSHNLLIFKNNYVESALHEIAHWCIAGRERLKLEDWGYWYQPEGRSNEQQMRFMAVESRNQAVEWALCTAAGVRFRPSLDNPGWMDCEGRVQEFHNQIVSHLRGYLVHGLPERAGILYRAFQERRGLRHDFSAAMFSPEDLK